MLDNIIMNNVIFIRTERGKQALQFIREVIKRGNLNTDDENYLNPLIGAFILKGLDILEKTEVFPYPATDDTVPWEEQDRTLLILENGDELEQSLVKLLAVYPIYEFRIDVNRKEYFRAIFFPFVYEGENYYCFTHAFIKVTGDYGSDKTDLYRDTAKAIYENFRRTPRMFKTQLL